MRYSYHEKEDEMFYRYHVLGEDDPLTREDVIGMITGLVGAAFIVAIILL